MYTFIPPTGRLRVPHIGTPNLTFAQVAAAQHPFLWARCNTASGSESDLGYGGGSAISFGSSGTRVASGGPTLRSGYYTNPASAGNSFVRTSIQRMWSTFTCMVFVKLPSSGNNQASHSPTIIGKREYFASGFGAFPFSVTWNETLQKINVSLDSGNDFSGDQTITTADNSVPVSVWNHIAVVVRPSGSNVDIYRNGVLLQSTAATTTIPVATSSAAIWTAGASNEYSGGAGNSECLGDYSEFMVFERALSATDISDIYNARNY